MRRSKPSSSKPVRRVIGIRHREHDVVEVVLEVGRALDQAERDILRAREGRRRRRRARRGTSPGSFASAASRSDTRSTMRVERAALARAVGVEERQLAAPGVGADERERVCVVDLVHAEVLAEEARDRVALRDPEGDVVESGGLHDSITR